MKFDFNLCKIKKITAIEISALIIVFVALGIYYSPKFFKSEQVMMAAKIKADNAAFTSKVLEEFSSNSKAKSSDVAKKVSEELNLINQNPYNKTKEAYTFELNCKGCNSIETNDNLSMVILTTYDKKGEMIARTVIKPPSFVTYSKDEEENN